MKYNRYGIFRHHAVFDILILSNLMGVDDMADIQKSLDSGEVSVNKKVFPRRSSSSGELLPVPRYSTHLKAEVLAELLK